MEEWAERFVLLAFILLIPAAILILGILLKFGGILLIIGMMVWVGVGIVLFSPAFG